jgi:hypothetical protein
MPATVRQPNTMRNIAPTCSVAVIALRYWFMADVSDVP